MSCVLKAQEGSETILKADSKELEQTIITPHMEVEVNGDKNILYCLAFQLAWNELKDNMIKEDIRLKDEPLYVVHLNKALSSKEDVSEKDCMVMAGFGKDRIIEKINSALKENFGDEAPQVLEKLSPTDIMVYAYLYKNLKFKYVFESLESHIEFESNGQISNVRAFGIKRFSRSEEHENIAKQVSVIDYRDRDDFIIILTSESFEDEIILAKMTPASTLLKTIEAVERRIIEAEPDEIRNRETLQIPKFNFDITHSYNELIRKFFRNRDFEEYFITEALQNIRFKLDEKGALLKSEARIRGAPISPRPKFLIFDKPFLLIMKEKNGTYPYFAVWVNNAELMVSEK
jgi:hypothetical protein